MFTADVPLPAEAGKALFAVWDAYLAALANARTAAVALETLGTAVPNADQLGEMLAKIKDRRDEADRGWWWATPEDVEAAYQRTLNGHGIPLEDILRELQAGRK